METLRIYRDDGPLADVFASVVRGVPLPSMITMLVGLLIVVLGLVADGATTGLPTVVGVSGFVLMGLTAAVALPHPNIQWLVPPMLRGAEYFLVLMLAWRADPQTLPVAYGLLAALAFHHYDIVYRLRHQRVPPPGWVRRLGGGWELRTVVIAGAAVLGISEPVMLAVAVWCGVLFVGESMVSWISVARDERRTVVAGIEEDDEAVD